MTESIDLICNSENYIKEMGNLEVNVYSKIAQYYKTPLNTVKSDIAKATNNMNKIRASRKEEVSILKFTPKSVIYYVVEKIKNI